MKKLFFTLALFLLFSTTKATIHVIQVWDGYYQFTPSQLSIQLGDTIQWLPLDQPMMTHTITSSNIPDGALEFDQIWEAPADTFFQYVPTIAGVYDYVCTPHEDSFNMVGSFTVETPSGIVEKEIEPYKLYPNPAYDFISIEGITDNLSYTIITLNGRKTLTGILNQRIDISALEPGLYVIRIEADRPKSIVFQKK